MVQVKVYGVCYCSSLSWWKRSSIKKKILLPDIKRPVHLGQIQILNSKFSSFCKQVYPDEASSNFEEPGLAFQNPLRVWEANHAYFMKRRRRKGSLPHSNAGVVICRGSDSEETCECLLKPVHRVRLGEESEVVNMTIFKTLSLCPR
ncbi:hypothetical protein CEXT_706421 [Caerostris extrusa]|uniref:Uncharacterized protein n=1 Tax=Caerostris extrusa TaxID=172846 RepID=A0AAV4QEY9_CAEEX|nr:hypothetical protein CEXT_706421 [Caerostris extrusa]